MSLHRGARDSRESTSRPHAPRTETVKTDIAKIIRTNERHTAPVRGKLPELLSPAGSLDALRAAIAGGADAVYFGGGDFNARINAKNFTNDEIKYAIDLLHSCGRKAYITLNTLVHGRELEDYLRFAEFVYGAGADALIVADMGGAQEIHRRLPDLELHASTQMSGHNLAEAELLSKCGFSRMVCARELPRDDIEHLVKSSPIEIEMFVHGALCVCHSGQCLFSSLVGGRSGNRGECAQPCRLPYRTANGESYPLSLKDLSLASHITELIDCGVHSLKIEGRMKSPEYVFGVVRAFRTLLDEGKNATPEELSRLSKIFSRGGFTDGYYERKINTSMLGVRSDEQKAATKLELYSSENIYETKPKKSEISASITLREGEPSVLTLTCGGLSVAAYGTAPEKAINAPLSRADVEKNISRLGNTPFTLNGFDADIDDGIILPVSTLNALRREACEMLREKLENTKASRLASTAAQQEPSLALEMTQKCDADDLGATSENRAPATPKNARKTLKTARFYTPAQISERAREYFDIIYLPLHRFGGECEGVILPPVILDSEREKIEKMLDSAVKRGAKYALVGNLGAIELARSYGLSVRGDFRFNVYNNGSVAFLESLGVESIMLSPELTLPQMRDIEGDTCAIVYGRIPLMLLEKCVIREISTCTECQNAENAPSKAPVLIDRRGVAFPTLREFEHRNTVYNSLPTYMADRQSDLDRAQVTNRHFIFSIETANEIDEIIENYENETAKDGKIRRI